MCLLVPASDGQLANTQTHIRTQILLHTDSVRASKRVHMTVERSRGEQLRKIFRAWAQGWY